ncbi:sugar phosphate isomerase/epimerase [Sphaerisporangium sp. TRM90804]|uniref:sugar phosphate isomerase/epimerase family protein n=1 Tax=Sphaerisporangium sp. TRM90804 TaxID=3031113 RepID=UPI00244A5FE2|nr:sugar phosphate isomerase/epimerase [Sphaerisporangium sp. TRM90804]MDH2430250.1 sugar phosphate isomerase/epimerase [Sphaerisporangium sp. TRM90804]
MKLGFLTACLPESDLSDIAHWAADEGFDALEVAAWPGTDARNHIRADRFDEAERIRVRKIFQDTGLTLSSLAYYENNLHPGHGPAVNAHLRDCIDAAAELGCPTVGTFIGRDPGLPVADNLRRAEEVFAPLVEHARRRDVTIVIENCVMKSWHPDGYPGNLAYSPELWEWMFTLGLKLNYDPSHLVALGIDPVAAVAPYIPHIAHVQAKDTEILPGKIDRYGFYGPVDGEKGWYRFRVPGLGQVDWTRLVDALYEGGYDGVVSVEHEDPVWSGDTARTQAGLGIAYRALRPLILG